MGKPWIKIALDTPRKPELEALADMLALDPRLVLGALVQLWCWVADQTEDGSIRSISVLDRVTGISGLGDSMLHPDVGWLEQDPTTGSLSIPDFERWIGSAKVARRKDAARKRTGRSTGRSTGHSTERPPSVHPPQSTEHRAQKEHKQGAAGRASLRWANFLEGEVISSDKLVQALGEWTEARVQAGKPVTEPMARKRVQELVALAAGDQVRAIAIVHKARDGVWNEFHPLPEAQDKAAEPRTPPPSTPAAVLRTLNDHGWDLKLVDGQLQGVQLSTAKGRGGFFFEPAEVKALVDPARAALVMHLSSAASAGAP